MSYILDALRKADAERDRGTVPGIHAQPMFGGAAPAGAQRATSPWLLVGAGAVAVLLVVAVAWYLMSGRAPHDGVQAAAPAPAAVTATPPAPVAVAPAPTPVPAASAIEAPLPRIEPAPAPIIRKPKAAAPASIASPKSETKSETKTTTPAASGAADTRVYAVNELPDDIRRQLPSIAVSSSMYSSKPSDRILIINGQVLHEGDQVTPEVVLQQIRLKAAVLTFKGYRYSISF